MTSQPVTLAPLSGGGGGEMVALAINEGGAVFGRLAFIRRRGRLISTGMSLNERGRESDGAGRSNRNAEGGRAGGASSTSPPSR